MGLSEHRIPTKSPNLFKHVAVTVNGHVLFGGFVATFFPHTFFHRTFCSLRPEMLASYAWQMCSGLAYLHYHYIVHRAGAGFLLGMRAEWSVFGAFRKKLVGSKKKNNVQRLEL